MDGINTEITIITGVIGSDIHFVGNTIMRYALKEAGYKVISLGTQVSQEEFIKAAIEADADAIFVSSLNGLAEIDCQGFGDKCKEAGLKGLLLYLGGNLAVGLQDRDWKVVEQEFMEMGFHRVYPPGITPDIVTKDFEYDLEKR